MKTKMQSKTIRFQVIAAVINSIILAPQAISPYMSAETASLVVLVLTAFYSGINVWLRTVTTEPVE